MAKINNNFFINEVSIIGPGLIGSSLALALKKKKIVEKIIGFDSNKKNLKDAIKVKAIDEGFSSIDKNISNSEIIFLCTPVGTFKEIIDKTLPYLRKKSIITDVGSVKNIFSDDINDKIKEKSDLVPAHPIAGTEFSGALNAKSNLFKNKWCILTPQKSNKENVNKIRKIWEILGMKTTIMSPEDHDKIMSITSHLPHLIAFTIVSTAFNYSSKEKKKLLNFSAGGFRDFTRIASSDPVMWKDIFLSNRKNVLETIEEFIDDLNKFKDLIKNKNEHKITNLIKKTKTIRQKVISLNQN